jgi:hypothetical protein
MKDKSLRWVIPLALLLIGVAFLVYESKGAVPAGQDLSSHELSLVSARCTKAESLDRSLLQQSWFHDPAFTRLGGAFGQTSFSLDRKEGAFCISGTDLMVRYYERRFVPIRVRLSELAIDFGTKLVPLGEDVYSVRELTKDKMVLTFATDGREHVYYRKN